MNSRHPHSQLEEPHSATACLLWFLVTVLREPCKLPELRMGRFGGGATGRIEVLKSNHGLTHWRAPSFLKDRSPERASENSPAIHRRVRAITENRESRRDDRTITRSLCVVPPGLTVGNGFRTQG